MEDCREDEGHEPLDPGMATDVSPEEGDPAPGETVGDEPSGAEINRKKIAIIAVAVAVLAAVAAWWVVSYLLPHNAAVDTYKAAASGLEQRNAELDEAIASLQDLMDSGDQPLDPATLDTASAAIGDAQGAKCAIPEMPGDTDAIYAAAEEVEQLGDYSEQLDGLAQAQSGLQDSIEQYKLVANPTEQYVVSRIKGVKHVTGVEAVTEKNDPNGQLNKDGGYAASVYFAVDQVDRSQVYSSPGYSGLPAAGCDAGGCVEVYATAAEAQARDEYLGAYDGTILASGSHTVAGTCVVRTSDLLTASQQDAIESAVISSLTKLDR